MLYLVDLKKIWKNLRINGQVKNYSNKELWVLETDSGRPIAHLLKPGMKTPPNVDIDAFKRSDNKPIEGHTSWWKIYDLSIAEIYDSGADIKMSVIKKTAVNDKEFTNSKTPQIIYQTDHKWGQLMTAIIDSRRNPQTQKITEYYVSNIGWINFEQTFEKTCRGEIDNARPVFPKLASAYIRTRRDKKILNNISSKKVIV